jgi:hypothetical protein
MKAKQRVPRREAGNHRFGGRRLAESYLSVSPQPGFLAPILRARHAGDRQARDKMPNGLIAAVAIAALCVIGSAAADTIYVSNEKDNT